MLKTENLIVTIDTLIQLGEDKKMECELMRGEIKILQDEIRTLKKSLKDADDKLAAIHAEKMEIRKILTEINEGERADDKL